MTAQAEALSLSPLRQQTREFDKFDTNKDGKLDGSEILKMPHKLSAELFEKAYSQPGQSQQAVLRLFGTLPAKTMATLILRFADDARQTTNLATGEFLDDRRGEGRQLMHLLTDVLNNIPESKVDTVLGLLKDKYTRGNSLPALPRPMEARPR